MEKKLNGIVISGFPGIGKSYITKNKMGIDLSMADSDSSLYSWIYEDGKKTETRNPEFPKNYIDHILELIKDGVDIIFVSSHKNVREAMTEAGIEYITVYPDKSLKYEYIERFKARGNDNEFIKFINDNWDRFIDDIEESEEYPIKLNSGTYLSSLVLHLTNIINKVKMDEKVVLGSQVDGNE